MLNPQNNSGNASRTIKLTAELAATLPAYGVPALGLWKYAIPAVLIVLVALWGATVKERVWLGGYYVVAACIGAIVQSRGFSNETAIAIALPIWIMGAAIVWALADESKAH
jgi:hypothetical protein